MSSEVAISVKNISKRFEIYGKPRDRLLQFLAFGRRQYFKEFWALRDISFEIKQGEAVAIVGRNGSGKSTLLQIICGTLSPTSGTVDTNGRIAALLELGSGFNPEFTGRENVYLNASVLGLDKKKVDELFDRIAAFADIGDHLDQPVKTYSSGMLVRLAFAVQAHLAPDILIIDEALSVGDQFFQAKCYSAIRSMMDDGCTVLFVSHSAATVKALCGRAVLLDSGNLVMDGPASKVLDHYFVLGTKRCEGTSAMLEDTIQSSLSIPKLENTNTDSIKSELQPPFPRRISERIGRGQARFIECLVMSSNKETTSLATGKVAIIRAVLEVYEDCSREGEIGLVVSTIEGVELFAINSFFQGIRVPPLQSGKSYIVDFEFTCPLSIGARYKVDLGYRMPVQGEYVDKVFACAGFSIINQSDRIVPLIFDVPGRISIR